MYVVLLLLFVILALLICKGMKFCCDADSEPDRFQVPTAAAATTRPSTTGTSSTSPVTMADPRPSMGASSEYVQHRTAMGNILIDDNNNNDTDDEDEIDLNASSADGSVTAVSKILSADFGDDNVHPIEETSCSICLINYQHGDRIQRNAFAGYGGDGYSSNHHHHHTSNEKDRCDHVFHPECITSWVKTNTGDGECPICRRPFILISPV